MMSRVRCSCGRIYDPAKHPTCPDCGAESAVESVVVAEKVKPPAPPEPLGDDRKQQTPAPTPDVLQSLKTLPWPVYAGAAFVVLLLLIVVLRHHNSPDSGVAEGEHQAVAPQPSPSSSGSASDAADGGHTTPIVVPTPAGAPTFPSSGYVPGMTMANLGELIDKAAPNGTVKLPPGFYQGGVVVNKPVRIVGEGAAGQVVVQSEGKEGLSVRSKGVFVQNVMFMSNGIGQLPAVSVVEGAELELDGCKIQSGSAIGVQVLMNGSIKASGTSFTSPNGPAIRMGEQARASFTQCTLSDSKIGLSIQKTSTADLHSCAFTRLGTNDSAGAIMVVLGEKTQITADDCQFSGNNGSLAVGDKASAALTKCVFKDNARYSRGSPKGGVVVLTNGGHGEIRDCTFTDGSPYAVNVMGAATLLMENTEVSGARSAGLAVGDPAGVAAQAEVKHSHFSRNAVGIGIFGGSSAQISDSECRENNEGIVVVDRGTHATLTKAVLGGNRDHGLYVYGEAEAEAVDCQLQGNARGAASGMQRKSGGVVSLQGCRVANNQVFGVGVYSKSQLSLNAVTFESNGKTNIFHENGAILQTDGTVDAGQAQAANDQSSPGDNQGGASKHSRKRTHQQVNDEDARRMIRRFFRP